MNMPNERRDETLMMGAVAYDPKVVAIWNGFRDFFNGNGLAFDYVLYSNYERQVEALMNGHIDVAWNSPLAWLQTEAAARSRGRNAKALCMRDTDRDLSTVLIVRSDSKIETIDDVRDRRVGVGAADSPQARLIPLGHLAERGLVGGADFEIVGFEVGAGLHGDHVGGERDAVEALVDGSVDVACILDANHLAFAREGLIPTGSTRILDSTPLFDHCNFSILDDARSDRTSRFIQLLLSMSYADPVLRPLLDMEGLKQWLPGRVDGYGPLSKAVERFGVLEPFLERLGA